MMFFQITMNEKTHEVKNEIIVQQQPRTHTTQMHTHVAGADKRIRNNAFKTSRIS